MNGDMMGANDPTRFNSGCDTLGLVPMAKSGPLARAKIECLTESDFNALLNLAENREDIGDNLILAEAEGEVRLFWSNDVGDSACWRFPEKNRAVVKNAVTEDLKSNESGAGRGGLL